MSNKPKIAVAITHGHAPKWLQTVIASIKKHKNHNVEFDIFIKASWPDHVSLKGLTETKLGENVNISNCKILWRHGPQFSRDLGAHATGLDEALDDIISIGTYDYMFTLETDCRIMRDGWLDWYLNAFNVISHSKPGMAGFFWIWGQSHYNINPSATLYDLRMLEQYHNEVRNNDSDIIYHRNGNISCSTENLPPKFGVFSERRGIANPNPQQHEEMTKGILGAGWFEPGSWLYYRSIGEWDAIRLPCDHIQKYWTPDHFAPEGTFYGGVDNPYVIHYWGGTRAWDGLKHVIEDPFVRDCADPWKEREHNLWLETVSKEDRKIMLEILEEIQLV